MNFLNIKKFLILTLLLHMGISLNATAYCCCDPLGLEEDQCPKHCQAITSQTVCNNTAKSKIAAGCHCYYSKKLQKCKYHLKKRN